MGAAEGYCSGGRPPRRRFEFSSKPCRRSEIPAEQPERNISPGALSLVSNSVSMDTGGSYFSSFPPLGPGWDWDQPDRLLPLERSIVHLDKTSCPGRCASANDGRSGRIARTRGRRLEIP